jgi:hypothetical protein
MNDIESLKSQIEEENRKRYGDNNWAVVRDGLVISVIVWDSTNSLGVEGELIHSTFENPAFVGGTYVDGQFLPPPEPEVDPPVEI